MKKNKALNNKGFVLAETLIVAVSISVMFALVFKNFYPLMGEYEVRENYDDIDSKYGTYWIKKFIQSCDYNSSFISVLGDTNPSTNPGFVQFSCDNINNETSKSMCKELIKKLEISCDDINTTDIEACNGTLNPHIYITKFNLVKKDPSTGAVVEDLKKKFYESTSISEDVKNYIRYLPEYSKITSLNNAQYRIIVEYYRHRFDTPEVSPNVYQFDPDNDFKTYATIEVKKEC